MQGQTKYGLQLRVKPSQQRAQPTRPPRPPPFTFNEDDDDNVEREITRQASKNKALKDIEEQHKKALEEDPSVFDYDGVYDEMKAKAVRPLAQDRQERKSKYIQLLKEKAKEREREHEIVYERKLAKERSKEDDLYADKDKFVTSAYKKKLAEQAKWLEEERLRELREEKDDIVAKKGDMSEFYFSLSKNVAFGAESKKQRKQREELKSSTTSDVDSSSTREGHQAESSRASKERNEPADTKPISGFASSKQLDEAKQLPETSGHTKQEVAGQPLSDDHHKRSQDALAAAKERFLARKKAKV